MLSSPLTGHQNTKADETQSSQTQEYNIHGVKLGTGGSRSHTWKIKSHLQSQFIYIYLLHTRTHTKELLMKYILVTASM